MTKDEEVQAGKRVEALLADEAVQKTFTDLESQYISTIKSSPADSPALADAVAGVRAIEAMKTSLKAIVDAGKIATVHLRKQNERPKSR
jgi:hypothetical protein